MANNNDKLGNFNYQGQDDKPKSSQDYQEDVEKFKQWVDETKADREVNSRNQQAK